MAAANPSKLNRHHSVALYVQIADRLAKEIAEKRYKVFERLPTEHELMARLGVSRITVRQAIARLVSQGLVVSKQGKGTFVAGPVVHHELEELKGFYDTLVGQGHTPQTQLLAFGPLPAPPDIEQLLGAPQPSAMFLKRLYSLEGRPFAMVRAWLPSAAQSVSWDDAVRHPLYAILRDLLGLPVARAEVGIVARQADDEEARLLELEPSSPVLVMERMSLSKDGRALEISRFSIRPENYRFRLSVQGPLAITSQIQETTASPRRAAPPAASAPRQRKPKENSQ
ncbi:MAG: GntR family transcriptional regulator [Gammaproteobacteria bacterium]|nr:GntR family transcriptional regulator [Gammaproteobacteria bacterium]MBU1444279.1 GntR family transcriptional regulator [Gammaproteobacteria bacterium]MBU2286215.1 GntR family transcriptional regulator [Gammaproteobacteria bacterium]MBU2408863.1 GntR family transcriptional regulator [Gammaproteobacteria bacterium]